MPILTLNLTSNTNVIELPKQITSQHLRLKMYSAVFNGAGIGDTALFLDMVGGSDHWLAADCINAIVDSSGDKKDPSTLFMLPVVNKSSHDREFTAYPDIKLSASHIPKSFSVIIYGQDASTKITSADLTSLRLVFEYDFPTK